MNDKNDITIDGKPLREYLEEEKGKEARGHRSSELQQMKGMVYNRTPLRVVEGKPEKTPCRVYTPEQIRRFQIMNTSSLSTSTLNVYILSVIKEWDKVKSTLKAEEKTVTTFPTPASVIHYMNIKEPQSNILKWQVYDSFKRFRKYLVPTGHFEYVRPQLVPTPLFARASVESVVDAMNGEIQRNKKAAQDNLVKSRKKRPSKKELPLTRGKFPQGEVVASQTLEAKGLSEELVKVLRSMSDVVQEIHIVFKTRP